MKAHHSLIKHLALMSAAVALAAHSANAQGLLVYEPFPATYTNGGAAIAVPQGGANYSAQPIGGTTSASTWTLGGGTGGGSPQIVGGPANLSYPGLGTTAGSVGLYMRTNGTTGNRTRGILLSTSETSGTVYSSFLLNVEQAPASTNTTPRQIAQLSSLTTGISSSSCVGFWIDSSTNLLISKNSTTVWTTNTSALSSGTHLIVARYTFNPNTADDEVDLWVDPASGTFGAPEISVPTPGVSTTAGSDLASVSSFYIYHPSSGFVPASLFIDEIRVGTTWADVTPTTIGCTPAVVSTSPTNTTVSEGIPANFSVSASGTSPTLQWQVSTNGGTTWRNATTGSGTNTSIYTTQPLTTSDNTNQYRCIVSVACGGGSSATSAVATVTVLNPVITPVGLVLEDHFSDFGYQDPPITASNSVWCASTTGSLDASSGVAMLGTPGDNASRLWIGYFTDNSVTNLPVHLNVGNSIKATLAFTLSGTCPQTNNGIRIGLYDYADGGTRVTADGFGTGSSGNGQTVTGYMLDQNFGTTFFDNQPQTIYVRNNLPDGNLMGTTGDYASLGHGPAGSSLSNAPAFSDGTNFTLEFTVTRTATKSATISTKISGVGTNWTTTLTDTNYYYHRFDAIALRPNNLQTTASSFSFSDFKVEVLAASVSPIPLNIQTIGSNVVLTWTNSAFSLQSSPQVVSGYTNIPSATSPYTNAIGATPKFFRLSNP